MTWTVLCLIGVGNCMHAGMNLADADDDGWEGGW